MKRRDFIKQTGAGAAVATLPFILNACTKRNQRPNILFIMTDDHAFQAISAYGSRINVTPNIDKLAKEGVRFTQSFCTNSICAPCRAVLLTGKYSHINGVRDNRIVFDGSQQTFPRLLQKAGYQTACIGKWHLKSEPTGFDYWNVLPGQGHYYNPDFIEMGEKKRFEGYVTDLITDFSLDWLEKRNPEKPFCLLLHHKAPHRNWMPGPGQLNLLRDEDIPLPESFYDDYASRSDAAREQEMRIEDHMNLTSDLKLSPPDDSATSQAGRRWENMLRRLDSEQRKYFVGAYKAENDAFHAADLKGNKLAEWKYQRYIKDYLRCIASVDENIGRVMKYLEENGLNDNTVVVYTSDQGFYLGEHGWFDKRFMYEESLRMPLIVRFPDEITPGINESDMVMNLDFAPTFLDYAGVRVPHDMQGRSMRRILKGSTPGNWRESIYYHYFEYPAVHAVKRHYGIRTKKYKLIHFYYDIDAWELYDLENDPQELNNIYDTAPAALINELKAELDKLREKYGDTDEERFLPQEPVKIDHMAKGCAVTLKHPYAKRYSAGGPNGLTNGLAAPLKVREPADYKLFQGFEKNDLDAVIDLGAVKKVGSVSVGCIQNYNDWIFLPLSVDVSISEDGTSWQKAASIKTKVSSNKRELVKKIFKTGRLDKACRYIRVKAENRRVCPENHPGAGRPAWLFADEIVVKI